MASSGLSQRNLCARSRVFTVVISLFCCLVLGKGQNAAACDLCEVLVEADQKALEREGKAVMCDPACLDGEDVLYCNALGLGQECRMCDNGGCQDCKPCPDNYSPSPRQGTAMSVPPADENDCAACLEIAEGDAKALLRDGFGVVCDPSCVTGETLHCNIFGLGQVCRLCGSCEGCRSCSHYDGTTAASSPAPASSAASTQTPTSLSPVRDETIASQSLSPTAAPLPLVSQTAAPLFRVGPRTLSPTAVGTSPPMDVETPERTYNGSGECPIDPPGTTQQCTSAQEGLECAYNCYCCDQDTEVDEKCQPMDPLSTDNCVFATFAWCDQGAWVRAEADPYCPRS